MVHIFEFVGNDVQRIDNSAVCAETFASGRPLFLGEGRGVFHFGERNRFHNLTEHAVAEYHNG